MDKSNHTLHNINDCNVYMPSIGTDVFSIKVCAHIRAKVWISYHVFAKPSRSLAASKAGGGVGDAIGSADGIPVLKRAGATSVTLGDQSILLIGHLRSTVTNTSCPLKLAGQI